MLHAFAVRAVDLVRLLRDRLVVYRLIHAASYHR
jgi:hypothetical protein